MRAMSEAEIFGWARANGYWLLTENVKDFRPILARARPDRSPVTGILCTSSRTFPRSRKNPGPLIQAVGARLRHGPPEAPLAEDWLLPGSTASPARAPAPGFTGAPASR